jgi:hypothetical protein
MRKALMLSAAIVGVTMVAEAAIAQPTTAARVPPRAAPAPLLAAGIPAFAALGGAAAVGRFVRRRKAKTSVQTEGAELASNEAS